MWQLAKWVQWLMWISVILNITSLFSTDFYRALLPILIAVGYTWVLKQVDAGAPTAPVTTPPVSV
jgi:hypothetical protein